MILTKGAVGRTLIVRRVIDLLVVLSSTPVLIPVAALVAIMVRLTSPGPALFWSERVGQGNRTFMMPKFRTMRIGTPQKATHLLEGAENYHTPIGPFLRMTSLDEIPQLWSVLKGDMTLIGPRPALFNQDDLIALRTEAGVHRLKPGISGLAQINGRDSISIEEKVALDSEYARIAGLWTDLKILALTAIKVVWRRDIKH